MKGKTKRSGLSSKKTSSRKWPILACHICFVPNYLFSSLSHCKFIWSGVILHYILPTNDNPFFLIWRRISKIKVFSLTKSEQNILRNQFVTNWLFSTNVRQVSRFFFRGTGFLNWKKGNSHVQ